MSVIDQVVRLFWNVVLAVPMKFDIKSYFVRGIVVAARFSNRGVEQGRTP